GLLTQRVILLTIVHMGRNAEAVRDHSLARKRQSINGLPEKARLASILLSEKCGHSFGSDRGRMLVLIS
ncbi:hypothetical protein, partial [Hydrogenophilus islandicus]